MCFAMLVQSHRKLSWTHLEVALPSERSNMICLDTPRSASLFNAHARKKRNAWYGQPTTLPRPGADAFPLSCTSGCARSDYGTAQRARCLCMLTLGSPFSRWCSTSLSCHRSTQPPSWNSPRHNRKAWMRPQGSPSACSSNTNPSCPKTSQLPNSNTQRRNHTARRPGPAEASTTSPRSPCACWCSTSPSCPQTTPLPNSNIQQRSRTAPMAGPAEVGPQELAVAGAVPRGGGGGGGGGATG